MELNKLKTFILIEQWLFILPIVVIIAFCITFLFFNSILVSSFSSAASFFFVRPLKNSSNQRLLKRRENEFMVFIYSLSSAISVGKSFESAFSLSVNELKYEGSVFLLLPDLEEVCHCFDMNMSVYDSLSRLSIKYPIESVLNFTKIIELAIIQGGSIEEIIDGTIKMIQEKNDVEKELEVIITQKKFELMVLLSFVPMMIIYLRIISSSFSSTMYDTFTGKCIMFICLCLYGISGYFGKKIVDIQV